MHINETAVQLKNSFFKIKTLIEIQISSAIGPFGMVWWTTLFRTRFWKWMTDQFLMDHFTHVFSALALTGEGVGPFESFAAVAVVHQLNRSWFETQKNLVMEWLDEKKKK